MEVMNHMRKERRMSAWPAILANRPDGGELE